MMKKTLAILLSSMMLAGTMAGYGSASTVRAAEATDAVTVNTAYGEVEVPYAPERICVLDLSVMDTIDALGLGDNVVVLQWHKHYPSYLETYYNSETIISLASSSNGHSGSDSAEDENADPYEMYYSIDADLIIGTTEKITEDLYEILCQIAPTVALTPAAEASEDLYTAVRNNTETIASIWGMEDAFEGLITPYDEIYTQLCEEVNGKSFVMASGNTELGLIQMGSTGKTGNSTSATEQSADTEKTADKEKNTEASDSAKSSGNNKKDNTQNAVAFLTELGMTNRSEEVSQEASAEAITAAIEAGADTAEEAALVIDAINAVEPDSVFIFNYSYGSLEELQADGFDLAGLDDLVCPAGFISIELTYTSGGLTAVTSMLDLMSGMFLG